MNEFIQKVALYYNGEDEVFGELYKGFPDHFLEYWRSQWKPSLDKYILQNEKRPEHSHWNWPNKAMRALINDEENTFFWIDYKSSTQGIMLTGKNISYFGSDLGKRNIYISFLEVAPWNYYRDIIAGYYAGVGITLLSAAIQYSNSLGYDGRIALESLPQSDGFYLRNKMIPVEKPECNSLMMYFELTTQNAREFLRRLTK
jgi:hypothetical protein